MGTERDVVVTEWTGCYETGWQGLIGDASFKHPAKFARGLIERIYNHLERKYGVGDGSIVVDPFGGIAGGALDALVHKAAWIGCELEPKFVALARENLDRWAEFYPDGYAVMVNGDSRKLADVIRPAISIARLHIRAQQREKKQAGATESLVGLILSSPPYAETLKGDGSERETAEETRKARKDYNAGGPLGQSQRTQGYGSAGNLGNLKPGDISAVVSSPPYAETINSGSHGIDWTKVGPATGNRKRGAGTKHDETLRDQLQYGASDGQMGAMKPGSVDAVVSSPPYAETDLGGDGQRRFSGNRTAEENKASKGGVGLHGTYGTSDGQMCAMKAGDVAAVVSSPPFGDAQTGGGINAAMRGEGSYNVTCGIPGTSYSNAEQGTTAGNLASDKGETFWEAAREVVQQCVSVLAPGGIAVWVVKAFVRDGAIVDFPGDWRRLCEACGLQTVEDIRASLVMREEHPGLFVEPVVKTKKRASFFRRIHEKKRPDLAIDYEVVWVMVKPC